MLNLSGCRQVPRGATPSALKVIGSGLFKSCSEKNMRSRLSIARNRSGHLTQAVGGSTGHGAIADSAGPMVELPPADVKRWTFRRKAAVVTAVANGELTREEACRRYGLTEEEFLGWQQKFETHGLPGLRSTRLQQYRRPRPRGR